MKYYIITYGCQMNKSDSERISSVLESIGYESASKENEAALIVVNMCSVRQSATDRVYGKIREFAKLKSQNLNLKTVLTGCILKKDREKLKDGYDLILDTKNLKNWKKYLSPIFHGRGKYGINRSDPASIFGQRHNEKLENYLRIQPKYQNRFSASIPISKGCNNCCTYCVVPFTRGKLICRPHQEILKEVKGALKNGAKEIWLLGQNVNRYRSKSKIKNQKSKIIDFSNLLKMVNDIPGNFWIRFTSPNPADFSDELIETMARCKKITPYLNLPVQSGDDEILKRMNRGYTVKEYRTIVKKIREKFEPIRNGLEKNITISTDAIVGFPGETKRQFENTVKLFKKIKFDMAYIAEYSLRHGTAAVKLKDDVSIAEKKRRQKVLNDILKKTALENNKKFVGKSVEILVEKTDKDFIYGKTRTFKNVRIQNPPISPFEKGGLKGIFTSIKPGQFIKVKIIKADAWRLEGKMAIKKTLFR